MHEITAKLFYCAVQHYCSAQGMCSVELKLFYDFATGKEVKLDSSLHQTDYSCHTLNVFNLVTL